MLRSLVAAAAAANALFTPNTSYYGSRSTQACCAISRPIGTLMLFFESRRTDIHCSTATNRSTTRSHHHRLVADVNALPNLGRISLFSLALQGRRVFYSTASINALSKNVHEENPSSPGAANSSLSFERVLMITQLWRARWKTRQPFLNNSTVQWISS